MNLITTINNFSFYFTENTLSSHYRYLSCKYIRKMIAFSENRAKSYADIFIYLI
jgi:hypothetical protein